MASSPLTDQASQHKHHEIGLIPAALNDQEAASSPHSMITFCCDVSGSDSVIRLTEQDTPINPSPNVLSRMLLPLWENKFPRKSRVMDGECQGHFACPNPASSISFE